MIKRLLCSHNFIYYHKKRYLPLFSTYKRDKWLFICKKCNKKSVLYDSAIEANWNAICDKVAREEALGKEYKQKDIVWR